MTAETHNVFISYSLRDQVWAREYLLPALRAAGLTTIDRADFAIGRPELENMERAVDASQHTLVVLTPAWVEDHSANFISLVAQSDDPDARIGRLLPLILEPCEPPARIRMLTSVDFSDPARRDDELQRLVDALVAGQGETLRVAAARPAAGPAHRLPPPVADFMGRDAELAAVTGHLSAAATTVAAIRGMAGVGKTQLALAAAAGLADKHPDQLMFDLQPGGQPLAVEALLARVLHTFEPELRVPETLGELQDLYRSRLAGRAGLLLLDNAATRDQAAALLPPPAGWAALVTSEARFPLDGARLCDLEPLSRAAAAALLGRMLGDGGRAEVDDGQRVDLATLCGGLPLALRVAAGYLTSTGRPVATYLAALARSGLKYLKDSDGQEAVTAVLSVSVERLGRADSALLRRWRDLAVFATRFDAAAAAAVWDMDPLDAQDALDRLSQQSLLDFDGERYALHELLREIALAAPPDDDVRYRHAGYCLDLGDAADGLYLDGKVGAGLALFDAALPELLAAFDWTRNRATEPARQWLVDFPNVCAYCLDLRMTAAQMVAILEASLDAARQLKDRDAESASLGNLGNAYLALGDPREAEKRFDQALAMARELGDRDGEAASLSGLGGVYGQLGAQARALDVWQQALKIARETGDRRAEGVLLNNLGTAYREQQEPQKAAEFYRQSLEVCRAIGDRPGEAAALNNLGSVYLPLEELPKAIACHEKALSISRELGDRQAEADTLGNLGNVFARQGDSARAMANYEQALDIHRELGDRASEALGCWNLGEELALAGRIDEAVEKMTLCVTYEREIGHPNAEQHAARLRELTQPAP